MYHITVRNNKVKVVYPGKWQLILDLGTGTLTRIPNKPFPDKNEQKKLRQDPVIESLYTLFEAKHDQRV